MYVFFKEAVAFYIPFMMLRLLMDVDAAFKRTGGGFMAQSSHRFNEIMARLLGSWAQENVRRIDEERDRHAKVEAEAMVQDEWTLGKSPDGGRIWLDGEKEMAKAGSEVEWRTGMPRKSRKKSPKNSRKKS